MVVGCWLLFGGLCFAFGVLCRLTLVAPWLRGVCCVCLFLAFVWWFVLLFVVCYALFVLGCCLSLCFLCVLFSVCVVFASFALFLVGCSLRVVGC